MVFITLRFPPRAEAVATFIDRSPHPRLTQISFRSDEKDPFIFVRFCSRLVKLCPFIVIALSAMLCSDGIAQTAHFAGESLVIMNAAHRILLPAVIESHSEYGVIHAVQKRAGDYFVVIGVSEWSRGYPPRGGNCGAGIESHIDWLHVHDGKVVRRQTGLYVSCIQNRDGYSIEWRHGVLHWSTEGQRRGGDDGRTTFIRVNYSWSFDPAHPENGIDEHAEDAKRPTPK